MSDRALLQTRVPVEVADWVKESSAKEAEKPASWLRRLLLREYRFAKKILGPRIGAVVWKKDNEVTVVVVSNQDHALKVIEARGWDIMNCVFLTEGIDLFVRGETQ